MVSPYPVQRSSSSSARSLGGARRLSNVPLRKAANENALLRLVKLPPAKRPVAGLLRLGRFVPYLGLALTLWELYELYEWLKEREGGYDYTGWTLDCSGPGSPAVVMRFAQPCSTNWTYFTTEFMNEALGKIYDNPYAGLDYAYFFSQPERYSSIWRAQFAQKLSRPNVPGDTSSDPNAPFPVTDPVPSMPIPKSPVPEPAPLLPSIDPEALPIQKPFPTPQPIPYPMLPLVRPNPWRHPQQQRRSGYRVPRPIYDPLFPDRDIPLPPQQVPYVAPPVAVGSSPEVAAEPLPVAHTLGKPKSGDKESKVKLEWAGGVLRIANTVTEGLDVIDAIYDALPSQFKPRYNGTRFVLRNPTPQQKLAALYEHWEEVDLPEAFRNLTYNEMQDRFFGALGRRARDFSRKTRIHGDLPIGVQAGPAL